MPHQFWVLLFTFYIESTRQHSVCRYQPSKRKKNIIFDEMVSIFTLFASLVFHSVFIFLSHCCAFPITPDYVIVLLLGMELEWKPWTWWRQYFGFWLGTLISSTMFWNDTHTHARLSTENHYRDVLAMCSVFVSNISWSCCVCNGDGVVWCGGT